MHLSLGSETILHIGEFGVTNSLINTWIAVLIFVAMAAAVKIKGTASVPVGAQNFLEYLIEYFLGTIDRVTSDRKKSEKFLPIVMTVFLFILVLNWMGLLPGTGSIGRMERGSEGLALVPIFRPGTSDLNTTLALAIFVIVTTHVFGILGVGIYKYVNKFINIHGLIKACKTFNPIKILTAIVNIFIGLIEIFSEFAKIISLSLRLFGNIFAGEVLLTVMASLIAFALPIPFMFLEFLMGLVQATIFSMLTLVFLQVATLKEH